MAATLAQLRPVNAQGKPNGLLKCEPASFYAAAHTAATLRLQPGTLGLCYLVPYGRTAQLIISYKGLIELAYRHPRVLKISAELVYKGEDFTHNKATGEIAHSTSLDVKRTDKNIIGAWCRVVMKDSPEPVTQVMSRDEIEAIRKTSPGANGNFWTKHYGRMARKTVIRSLFNGGSVPVHGDLQAGMEHEAMRDAEVLAVKDEPAEELGKSVSMTDARGQEVEDPEGDNFGLGQPERSASTVKPRKKREQKAKVEVVHVEVDQEQDSERRSFLTDIAEYAGQLKLNDKQLHNVAVDVVGQAVEKIEDLSLGQLQAVAHELNSQVS